MCFTCSVKVIKKSELAPGINGIPVNGVMKNDFFTLLMWAWCINAQKVVDAFKARTGLDITENDFPRLVKAHAAGADKAIHNISFMEVLDDLQFTEAEKKKSNCNTSLYR
jgi:hypothetical protein